MKTFHKCDHCNFTSEDGELVGLHEPKCHANPALHKCSSCKFWQWKPGDYVCCLDPNDLVSGSIIRQIGRDFICDNWSAE